MSKLIACLFTHGLAQKERAREEREITKLEVKDQSNLELIIYEEKLVL